MSRGRPCLIQGSWKESVVRTNADVARKPSRQLLATIRATTATEGLQVTDSADRVHVRGVGHEDRPILSGEVLQVQVGTLHSEWMSANV